MSDNTTEPGPGPEKNSELRTAVAGGKKRRRNILIGVGAAIVALLVAGGVVIAVNSGNNSAAASGPDATAKTLHVKIATSEDSDFQDEIKTVAAEKGLDVEWVNLDDWVLPNTELVAGNVDANAFQHILYLSAFNAQNKADITPVFSTVITQWGVFSSTLKSLDKLPDGAHIAIPDDPSNAGRALFILQAAKLITLKDGVGDFPTTDDVVGNPKNIQFVEIAAKTIPQQFNDPSLSAVVVGTSYFDPSQGITKDDALFLDDSLADESLPYVNVIATRKDDVDNPAWKILKKAYADPRVADALEKESFGSTVLVDVPVDKLRSKLADLEKVAQATK
ncbi:MetQ/NlpA family ABC transporter substrate-binding protein [Rathayibacter sp. YIM 133350]|uniref:MetQ/NlpA family ABC transporter substrate-binding protein n=1 Tax=Rathayibacter sp. YIM 133350 TaxID=3131992 RepID=UPI00307F00DD